MYDIYIYMCTYIHVVLYVYIRGEVVYLAQEAAPPLAYISGTLGVLIGADLMRLRDVRKLATPFASIGGAGTFDGIFLTGIIAVLLT